MLFVLIFLKAPISFKWYIRTILHQVLLILFCMVRQFVVIDRPLKYTQLLISKLPLPAFNEFPFDAFIGRVFETRPKSPMMMDVPDPGKDAGTLFRQQQQQASSRRKGKGCKRRGCKLNFTKLRWNLECNYITNRENRRTNHHRTKVLPVLLVLLLLLLLMILSM